MGINFIFLSKCDIIFAGKDMSFDVICQCHLYNKPEDIKNTQQTLIH